MALTGGGVCVGPLDVLCQAATGVAGSGATGVANMVLAGLGDAFVTAAQAVSTTALTALDATTAVDLSASWFTRNLGVIAAVSLPVVVALFVLQVIGSVLRREPGGLVRAVSGVGLATLGSVLAIEVTQAALVGTDGICQVIAASAGTTVSEAARRFLDLHYLAGAQSGPVMQMLLGTTVLVGCLLLWAVLLFRKAALLLVAVFAPIAFAGAVWDHTRAWTRRWVEAVVALVLCKIVIVVVFVLGIAAFANNATTTPAVGTPTGAVGVEPVGASVSDLLVGLVLLSIAVFAPWLTWRFVHWSGMEAATVLHSTMARSPIPAAARSTAGQVSRMGKSAAMTAVLGPAGGVASAAGGSGVARAEAAGGSAVRAGAGRASTAQGSGQQRAPRVAGPSAPTSLDEVRRRRGGDLP